MPSSFTYPKQERLKSRKAIEQLFRSGQSFFVYPYKVVYQLAALQKATATDAEPAGLPAAEPVVSPAEPSAVACPLLSGFAVSTRNFKHAVDRNRIKRLGREAFRLNKQALTQQLAGNQLQLQVFFVFTDKKLPDFTLIRSRMQICLKKLAAVSQPTPPL